MTLCVCFHCNIIMCTLFKINYFKIKYAKSNGIPAVDFLHVNALCESLCVKYKHNKPARNDQYMFHYHEYVIKTE